MQNACSRVPVLYQQSEKEGEGLINASAVINGGYHKPTVFLITGFNSLSRKQ